MVNLLDTQVNLADVMQIRVLKTGDSNFDAGTLAATPDLKKTLNNQTR